MKVRIHWQVTVGLLVPALLLTSLVSGCGGGGGVSGGVVTGVIRDADTGTPIGNIVVTVAGRTGTSQAPGGRFTVSGITPSGTYQVIVQPSAIFVPVPGPPVMADVQVGRTTDLTTVWVIDRANLPPSP